MRRDLLTILLAKTLDKIGLSTEASHVASSTPLPKKNAGSNISDRGVLEDGGTGLAVSVRLKSSICSALPWVLGSVGTRWVSCSPVRSAQNYINECFAGRRTVRRTKRYIIRSTKNFRAGKLMKIFVLILATKNLELSESICGLMFVPVMYVVFWLVVVPGLSNSIEGHQCLFMPLTVAIKERLWPFCK